MLDSLTFSPSFCFFRELLYVTHIVLWSLFVILAILLKFNFSSSLRYLHIISKALSFVSWKIDIGSFILSGFSSSRLRISSGVASYFSFRSLSASFSMWYDSSFLMFFASFFPSSFPFRSLSASFSILYDSSFLMSFVSF